MTMGAVRSVLALGAHPDDLEITCGGTLARYAKQGVGVTMFVATNGEKGGISGDPVEIARVRREEARRSGQVIGASVMQGPFPDGELEVDLESRKVIVDAIRQSKPDVVFTHDPKDYHPDHTNLSKLVSDALYLVAIPHFRTDHPALETVPYLYFFDTVSGINFLPEDFVDITDAIQVKKSMMAAHASQVLFLKDHHGEDVLEKIEITARFRGYQCNARYAEGFVSSQSWPRGATQRLLP
ncbi:MAG TPA: PIG-L family deacetylase [Spirochaetia bacterium]|nr:PIG-L family deacetylase [Spirochaetia bacterium]